jgi:hypothetical protein
MGTGLGGKRVCGESVKRHSGLKSLFRKNVRSGCSLPGEAEGRFEMRNKPRGGEVDRTATAPVKSICIGEFQFKGERDEL